MTIQYTHQDPQQWSNRQTCNVLSLNTGSLAERNLARDSLESGHPV
jgi:hypothetical protein